MRNVVRDTAWKAVAKLMESDRRELEFLSVYKSRLEYFYAHGLQMSSVWLYGKTLHFTAMSTMERVIVGLAWA